MTMNVDQTHPTSHPAPRSWFPDLSGFDGPRYLAIADAIAAAISDGTLPAGARLPTHRHLAEHLGVTVGTITRAYGEATRRGLIDGTVGRGTFAKGLDALNTSGDRGLVGIDYERLRGETFNVINLSVNRPVIGPQMDALRETFKTLGGSADLQQIMGYQFSAGHLKHRAAGVAWLRRAGVETTPDRVLVTSGCQNAQMVALVTVARPGDILLTEAFAYPGLAVLAQRLGLTLEGVAMDEDGMRPDAFEAACRGGGRRFVYLTPTLQNPTAVVMGEARRREIVEVARRYDALLLEDDVHGFLGPQRTPLAMLAPERTLFMTSVSKALMPGLRVGFLMVPQHLLEAAATTLRATTLMAPPLMAEVVATWIADGTADRLTRWQVDETLQRYRLVAARLDLPPLPADLTCFHVWLRLAEGRSADQVAVAARDVGVHVAPQSAFMIGRPSGPEALRISLSAAADMAELSEGLDRLRSVLYGYCPSDPYII